MNAFWLLLAAVLLDAWLGEPRRRHPLVGFGRIADGLERGLNRAAWPFALRRIGGIVALLLVLLPAYVWWRYPLPGAWQWAVEILVLYLALGGKSLAEHALAVRDALAGNDLALARERVGYMVSRDTTELDEAGVAKAAVESTLENGNDAVFGALFWFALLGGPGALAFRLANTLDAMWGYKTERLRTFGWAAARFDDLLNFVPARLTALSYVVLGNARGAWRCWRTQAKQWSSPNAGPVMAAGAGALNVRLGGAARYHGEIEQRPELGRGDAPQAMHIAQAVALMRRALWLWLVVAALWSVARHA